MKNTSAQILLYKNKNGPQLEIRFQKETLWLNQSQIATLFGIQRPAITKHLNNIFKSGELIKDQVCSKMEQTAQDGKKYRTQFFNLDAVISVGYRINSIKATHLRMWATSILKNHLIQGYTLNEKLLRTQERLTALQNAIHLLTPLLTTSSEQASIIGLLHTYSKTLTLLDRYDRHRLPNQGRKKSKFILRISICTHIISVLKKTLINRKEASAFFGQDPANGLGGIVNTLYQTFEKKELYTSIESKAAHLLYFVIKDHPFIDGNKRIGSTLFVYFLEQTNTLRKKSGEPKITDSALTALALLVAESNPTDKDNIIALIMNLISD